MRQLAYFLVIAGVLATPAFAQYPPSASAAIDGSWTARLSSSGRTAIVHLDLQHIGSHIGGRERILNDQVSVALQLRGGFTDANSGTLTQISVEELSGLP
jgi:hypothetical protein